MTCGECQSHGPRCDGYCSHYQAQAKGTSGACGNGKPKEEEQC